jgi:hypothetical protein
VISLSIEERLLHYFLAMGAQQVAEKPTLATLSFAVGNQTANVIVTAPDRLTQTGIAEAMLSLSALRATSNQLYLAAPRLLGATIDAQVFRAHGIGLLLYDDRRIDEAVPPQSLDITQSPSPSPNQPALATTAQLIELKSMYQELKDNITRLRDEMISMENKPKQSVAPSIEIPHSAFGPNQHAYPSTNALPSFFTNNPWLDVLSKRGRENGERLAG